jgi:hypothetical protein
MRLTIYACIGGMFYLGLFPGAVLNWATEAVKTLH